ncbi:MAG: aldo/keto reductase [Nitrospirota bacterium]|nr:MAG: aldo/keto reductase [Nitrospirota bacterium]
MIDLAEKRVLGRTGLKVSRLGLAGGYGISAKSVEKAYHDHGINYFFWSSPRKRGMRDGLRSLARTERDNIIIVLQSYDHIGITVKHSITKGMKALGVERVDVAMLGWHNWYPPKKLIKESLELVNSGLVGYISMSGHNRKLFGEIAKRSDNPIDIFMVRYNAAHRGAEKDIFPYLPDSNRPGLTTYTATCWGKLLDRKKMPDGERPLTADECYRFVLSDPHVDLCMIGPANDAEMVEGLKALDSGPLTEEEMERIKRIGDHVHGGSR